MKKLMRLESARNDISDTNVDTRATLSSVDLPQNHTGERGRDRQDESLIEKKRAEEWRHIHRAYKQEFPTITGFCHDIPGGIPDPQSSAPRQNTSQSHRPMLRMDLEQERLENEKRMPDIRTQTIQEGLQKRISQSVFYQLIILTILK